MRNALTFLLALFFAAQAQTTNTYTVDKTISASYSTMNAYVTAKGSTQISPMFAGGTWKVVGKCTVPSNIDLYGFANGFKFIGNTGSATDTLVISKMSARPMHQIFDTSVTVQFAAGAVDEVRPEWWGAKGDSLTNCTEAIKRAMLSGLSIVQFSSGVYLSDSLYLNNIGYMHFKGNVSSYTGGSLATRGKITRIQAIKSMSKFITIPSGHGFQMSDICISGGKLADTVFKIVQGTTQHLYKRCSFERAKATTGVLVSIGSTTNSQGDRNDFYDCIFTNQIDTAGAVAIHLQGTNTLLNKFFHCMINNFVNPVYMMTGTGMNIFDMCEIENYTDCAFRSAGSNNMAITNCYTECTTGAFFIETDVLYYTSAPISVMKGNWLNAINKYIRISAQKRWVVENNKMDPGGCYVIVDSLTNKNEGYPPIITNNTFGSDIDDKSNICIAKNNSVAGVMVSDRGTVTAQYLPLTKGLINTHWPIQFANSGINDDQSGRFYIRKNIYYSAGNKSVSSGFGAGFDMLTSGSSSNFEFNLTTSGADSANQDMSNHWKTSAKIFKRDSTSQNDTSGTCVVYGGFGVKKNIKAGDTTNSTSTTTGSIVTSGGIGAGKNIYSGAKIQSGDTLRTGNASSYAQLDSVNGLLLAGNATVWDNIRIVPGSTDRPGGSDPSLVAYGATYLWEFEKNDSIAFTIQVPHGYKSEDTIFAHCHWTPGSRGNEEGTATVGWKVAYSWASIDSVFPAFAVVDLSDACKSTDGQHLMTPEVGIPGSGKVRSSMLICNFKRTDTGGDDTWAGTASGQLPFLLEIDFHIPLNKLGSPTR